MTVADSDDADGFAPTCHNLVDRERYNSAFGYMDAQTRSRPNLTIRAAAEARKVLFAPGSSPPKACGVGDWDFVLTRRPFLTFSELQLWDEGVDALARRLDVVDVAVRESTVS